MSNAPLDPSGPVPTETAWLTALAFGLAYSHQEDRDCVEELLAAAGGRGDLLAAARRAERRALTVPPEVRRRARVLLADAEERHAARVARASTVSSAPPAPVLQEAG